MRPPNLESHLQNYLRSSKNLKFEWGINDCALWVAGFATVVLGTDFAAEWRGKYSTERQAQEYLLAAGYTDMTEVVSMHAGEVPVSMCQRGDIVLHPAQALGLCAGRRSYFLTEERGLIAVPTLPCRKAWRF